MLYRGGRLVANVVRKRKEVKQQQRAIGYSNQTTTVSPNPLPPKRGDEDREKSKEEWKNKQKNIARDIDRDIRTNSDRLPKGIDRVDKVSNKCDAHVHFRGTKAALYFDGRIKDGTIDDLRKVMTNDIKRYLIDKGINIPYGL